MTTTTPRTSTRRALTLAVATAFAGTAFLAPALSASAAEITAPSELAISDVSEWKADSFTIPATPGGLSWSYKIGTGEPVDVTLATTGETVLKPFEKSTKKPTVTTVTVTAKATDAANDTVKDGTGVYELVFKADKIVVAKTKAPTVKTVKTTALSAATVPYLKGIKWTYKEASTGDFGAVQDVVFPEGSTKPVDVTLTEGTTKVQFTASNADVLLFTLENLKAPVQTSWTFDVKTVNTAINVKNLPEIETVDNPGVKDWAEVTGVEGVQWMNGTKKVNAKPGQVVKVAPAKGESKVTVSATALPGYVLVEDVTDSDPKAIDKKDTEVTFTSTTDAEVDATVADRVVTVNASSAVKSWTFTPTGGKALKIALPKGASAMVFTAPGAGTLKADPVAGYKLVGGTADGSAATWTVS